MMLSRPLIDHRVERSLDVPFKMCNYHWNILCSTYRRYFIDLEEARSLAEWTAKSCSDCESPRWH